MRKALSTFTTLLLLFGYSIALAQSDEPTAPPTTPEPAARPEERSTLSHKYQFGASVRGGTGFRMIVPYGDKFCGKGAVTDPDSVCTARYPGFLEISPSFGVSNSIELFVDLRLLMENPDFTGAKGFFVSPGFKFYSDPESLFKLFMTAQLVFESQSQAANVQSFDFGARGVIGAQFDVLRYVGIYIQGGLVAGFTRWLSLTVDAAGGVQLRY